MFRMIYCILFFTKYGNESRYATLPYNAAHSLRINIQHNIKGICVLKYSPKLGFIYNSESFAYILILLLVLRLKMCVT